MPEESSESSKRRSKRDRSEILGMITAKDALTILRCLAEQDGEIAERIDDVAMRIFSSVDIESVASDVQMELESLDVEDVWDRSGSTRHEYVDPGDAAWQMFEDALDPFQDQIERHKQLSMAREAKLVCMGILKGIYDFHKESASEYKDWAVDAPGEYFSMILHDWQKSTKTRKDLAEMNQFIDENCPDWGASRRKKRR